jgi:hypothetical protein
VWRIFFEYTGGSKCTVTGKHKDIPLRPAVKYHNEYGVHAEKAVYQQYPKKNHEPMGLFEKIKESADRGE